MFLLPRPLPHFLSQVHGSLLTPSFIPSTSSHMPIDFSFAHNSLLLSLSFKPIDPVSSSHSLPLTSSPGPMDRISSSHSLALTSSPKPMEFLTPFLINPHPNPWVSPLPISLSDLSLPPLFYSSLFVHAYCSFSLSSLLSFTSPGLLLSLVSPCLTEAYGPPPHTPLHPCPGRYQV